MYELIVGGVLALLAFATVCDFKSREIPDWISILILASAVTLVCLGQHPRGGSGATAGFVLASILGTSAFAIGMLGGGDVKLLAAMGTLLGPLGWLEMVFWVAIAGGGLAIIASLRGQRDYAYVPAIAAGFSIVVLWPSATAALMGLPVR